MKFYQNRPFSTFSGNRVLRRKCSCGAKSEERQCDDCKKNTTTLLRKSLGGSPQKKAPPIVHKVLQANGNELDLATRSVMEPQFGHNFSKVRVHTDSQAAESARSVNALAYTVGNNIVFNSNQYDPRQSAGRKLLAHELTHVVQQSTTLNNSGELNIGQQNDLFENEADSMAMRLLNMEPVGMANRISSTRENPPVLQRQTPLAPSLIPPLNLPSDQVLIDQEESITEANTKLISLANTYKQMMATNPNEYIKVSTYLSDSSKLDSAKAEKEARQLNARMTALQNALVKLGISGEAVQIEQASMFSSKGAGQITASLYKSPKAVSSLLLQVPAGPTAPASAPSSTGAASSSVTDMLSFKFKAGPALFAVELPKSVSIKLPGAIKIAKTLGFELRAESSGDFSFSITLNGNRHLNVAAKAALKVDKDKGTGGSLGLEITSSKTVCNAPSPESLKTAIAVSGEKLTKSMKELEIAKPDERISKLIDIAGAIGEMYDAVDKSKSACKEVPIATFNFGYQAPLSPTTAAVNDPDPSKRPSSFLGGSFTYRF